jgi:hypothetical protein
MFDTFKAGYNATLGGDYLEGFTPIKGPSHHASDVTTYTLYHKHGDIFTGTRYEFCTKYKASTDAFTKLVKGKLNKVKGFALTAQQACAIDGRSTRIREKRKLSCAEIFKPSITCTSNTGNKCTKTPLETLVIRNKRSEFLKANNPTKGKARPQHVKDAVSKNRRSMADQTLRNWYHPTHGIEYQIRSIDLRDKYNLRINHLRLITHTGGPKHNSHKGWTLCTE